MLYYIYILYIYIYIIYIYLRLLRLEKKIISTVYLENNFFYQN